MPRSVGRVGKDLAGGVVSGPPLAPTVFVDRLPIVVVSTKITPHGKEPHTSAVMASGSPNVFAGSSRLPVCGSGHLASCGHPLISSSRVFVN